MTVKLLRYTTEPENRVVYDWNANHWVWMIKVER